MFVLESTIITVFVFFFVFFFSCPRNEKRNNQTGEEEEEEGEKVKRDEEEFKMTQQLHIGAPEETSVTSTASTRTDFCCFFFCFFLESPFL